MKNAEKKAQAGVDFENKLTVERVFRLDYNAVDKLITEVYGNLYQIHAEEELDSSATFRITAKKKTKYSKWDKRDIEKAYLGNYGQYTTRLLFDDMCTQNIIPEGTYIVDCHY